MKRTTTRVFVSPVRPSLLPELNNLRIIQVCSWVSMDSAPVLQKDNCKQREWQGSWRARVGRVNRTPWLHFIFWQLLCINCLFFSTPPSLLAEEQACEFKTDQGPDMVIIPAGRFVMGSPESEVGRESDEGPLRSVTVQNTFGLMRCEVSVAEFALFINETGYVTEAKSSGKGCYDFNVGDFKQGNDWQNPGFTQTNNHPVVCISWNDAIAYASWLTLRTGQEYRLPTEAEWEYAARAGTTTPFSTGNCINTDQANYNGTLDYNNCGANTGVSRGQTVPVEKLTANPWGLYHMHGNVWEWTQDCWHEDYNSAPINGEAWEGSEQGNCARHVVRGGGWSSGPGLIRSALRYGDITGVANNNQGFRLARTIK